ncbi:hypothetical protein E4T56_gene20140 [Termitomyces sp. T112]|nr:hypothetical protein E4T56_gene20140 [Termitomyces sp. T112]
MKSCLNPAATPRESHSSASLRPTSLLPPNNHEQPSSPIQAQLQEPPPLLRDNSAALQKTPHWSSPSNLQHNPTGKLRPNPNPHISSGPLVLALGTADRQNAPQTPSSARTSPKANTTNKPPPSDSCVDSGTTQFFSDEGTTDFQEGTTLGTNPKTSPLRRAILQPTPVLLLPKRNIHQHNSNRPPNSRECQKYMTRNLKFRLWTQRNWSGLITPHPALSVIDTPEHTKAPLEHAHPQMQYSGTQPRPGPTMPRGRTLPHQPPPMKRALPPLPPAPA